MTFPFVRLINVRLDMFNHGHRGESGCRGSGEMTAVQEGSAAVQVKMAESAAPSTSCGTIRQEESFA